MFFVIKGKLIIRFKDRDIKIEEGEFLIIPKGVEHYTLRFFLENRHITQPITRPIIIEMNSSKIWGIVISQKNNFNVTGPVFWTRIITSRTAITIIIQTFAFISSPPCF